MNRLVTTDEAAELIRSGRPLLIAGDEALLRALPAGRWLGGTIPYFMTAEGGVQTSERLSVTVMPEAFQSGSVKVYRADQLARIPGDYPANGASFIVIPGGSEAHTRYARENVNWPHLFDRPLVGWIAGVALEELGRRRPAVVNGETREVLHDAAAVLHLTLRPGVFAKTEIVNLFKRGDGDRITFQEEGFQAGQCLVNGERRDFSAYLKSIDADSRCPLVADFGGALINVAFQTLTDEQVTFYAPVVPNVEYRLARPLGDYVGEFAAQTAQRDLRAVFACNCVLNYVYAELKGKRIGDAVGPFTFGEIAWMLLNQTLVYLTLEERKAERVDL